MTRKCKMHAKILSRDLGKGGGGGKEDSSQVPPDLFPCLRFLSSIWRTRLSRSLEQPKLYWQEKPVNI